MTPEMLEAVHRVVDDARVVFGRHGNAKGWCLVCHATFPCDAFNMADHVLSLAAVMEEEDA